MNGNYQSLSTLVVRPLRIYFASSRKGDGLRWSVRNLKELYVNVCTEWLTTKSVRSKPSQFSQIFFPPTKMIFAFKKLLLLLVSLFLPTLAYLRVLRTSLHFHMGQKMCS